MFEIEEQQFLIKNIFKSDNIEFDEDDLPTIISQIEDSEDQPYSNYNFGDMVINFQFNYLIVTGYITGNLSDDEVHFAIINARFGYNGDSIKINIIAKG